MGDPQTLNLYGMVTGNPVSKQDSDGHMMWLNQEKASWGDLSDGGGGSGLDAVQQEAYQQVMSRVYGSVGASDAEGLTGFQGGGAEYFTAAQQKTGRQPDGSYIAPTGPGTPIGNITDPAKPVPPMIGNGQCVTACSRLSGVTADTSQWTPGAAVSGNSSIPIGTAIATFGPDNKFHSDGTMNSGIYMGQNKNGGIEILDQWTAHPQSGTPEHHPALRPLVYDRHEDGLSNSARYYHVIIVP